MSRDTKSRDYCFTVNNYTDADIERLVNLVPECQYIVWGKEVASTGTPHLQGYVYFQNQRYFNALKKKLPEGCHYEARLKKSTPAQASCYCKKGEQSKDEWLELGTEGPNYGLNADFTEHGICPMPQGKRTDIEIVREELNNGNGMRGVVSVATNMAQIRIAELILRYEEPKRDWEPVVHWYYGLTGTGKSRTAHEYFKGQDFYRKTYCSGKWWDGYDAHRKVIIDDFTRPTTVKEYKYWLDITDRYACTIESKGGTRQFLADEIIITCSQSPEELLGMYFEQDAGEFLRRIKYIREFK